MRRRTAILAAAVGVASALLAGCASTDETAADQNAQALVAATQAAGIAPELTPEIAESLYEDDAPGICGPLEDNELGLVRFARIPLWGMPEEKTQDLVEYDRLVVETYCPDQLDRFNEVLDRLNYEAP